MTIESTSPPRLAIVVPLFNEIAGVETCVRRLVEAVPGLPMPNGVIFVDARNTGGTRPKLKALQAPLAEIADLHRRNGCVGGAPLSGGNGTARPPIEYPLIKDI